MEEKYLVCYPVYKFQVTSDQPRYNERWDKSVSVCHNAILQINILVETPGTHSASRTDRMMASSAPLTNACEMCTEVRDEQILG